MRITLHIGAPKTGSTALQRFLTGNIAQLAQAGRSYPDVNLRGFGHHDLAFLLHGSYPDWATPQPRTLDDLLGDLRLAIDTCPRELILSSEDFYIFPATNELMHFLRAAGMRNEDDVRIVAYLRRQDEAHMSWYNQAVKAQGYTRSIYEALQDFHELWNYHAQLAPWISVFGKDAIEVRILENGDIRRDFLEIVGVPQNGFDFSAQKPNERLNRDLLEYQRLLNRGPGPIQEKRRFHKALIALSAATAGTDAFDDTPLLTSVERAEILGGYISSNHEIAREFLGRDELFDYKLPGPAEAPEWPGLTPEKIAIINNWIAGFGQPESRHDNDRIQPLRL